MAEEDSCMFRNIKAGSGFLFRKGAEFFIMVQQNLILVAMAGENIFNQRFRTVEGDGILVKSTVYRLAITRSKLQSENGILAQSKV